MQAVEFSYKEADRSVTAKFRAYSYVCSFSSSNINGRITKKVSGACFGKTISVILPHQSKIGVWFAGKPVNNTALGSMTPARLIEMIRSEPFDSNKLEILNKTLATSKTLKFNPSEGEQIVKEFPFTSSKKEVAIKIAARINKNDRLEYYRLIEGEFGHFDKQEVLNVLTALP